jgi:hypothetical protein
LQHGLEQAGYISEHNGIALANPQSLIGSTQKQLADGLRTVGEPVKSKKAVRGPVSLHAPPLLHMRKIIPNFPSMQISRPFWSALLP